MNFKKLLKKTFFIILFKNYKKCILLFIGKIKNMLFLNKNGQFPNLYKNLNFSLNKNILFIKF